MSITPEDKAALLAAMERMTPLSPETKEEMAALFVSRTMEKGEFFARQGESVSRFGFLCEGLFHMYYITHEGAVRTKDFCPEGEFVGALSALLRRGLSPFSIEAMENTRLITADYSRYLALVERRPQLEAFNARLAEGLYMKREERESDRILLDAAGRYRKFLSRHSDLEKRLKQHQIASYLGMNPVTLSRVKKIVEEELFSSSFSED